MADDNDDVYEVPPYETLGNSLDEMLSRAAQTGDYAPLVKFFDARAEDRQGLHWNDCRTLSSWFERNTYGYEVNRLEAVKAQLKPSDLTLPSSQEVRLIKGVQAAKFKRAGVADAWGVPEKKIIFVYDPPYEDDPEVAYFTTRNGTRSISYADAPWARRNCYRVYMSALAWEKVATDVGCSAKKVEADWAAWVKAQKRQREQWSPEYREWMRKRKAARRELNQQLYGDPTDDWWIEEITWEELGGEPTGQGDS